MKKILMLLSALLLVNVIFAQSRDLSNQGTKRTTGWSTQEEKQITKKKVQPVDLQKNNISINSDNPDVKIVPTQEQPKQQTFELSNSCEDVLTVELVSLVGSKANQEVNITIKYINHDVEKYMKIVDFKAFTEDGDVIDDMYPNAPRCDAATDVPIKAQWNVGKMLPSKNSKLTLLSFEMGDCKIEMRNVPITWK